MSISAFDLLNSGNFQVYNRKVPRADPNYSIIDNFKLNNPSLKGKIKDVRAFLSENPIEASDWMYPIPYLQKLSVEVA